MTYVLDERLKELTEDADREKALKDVANATAKEKGMAVEATEKKAQSLEKARLLVEEKLTEAEDRLGGIVLKLAEAISLNLAQADQIANLKAALEACKNKWYDEGCREIRRAYYPLGVAPWVQ